MRLYKIHSPTVPATFRTAEREAKERARELGINGRVEPVDVGTTKAELVPFLEDLAHREFQRGATDGHAEAIEESAPGAELEPAPIGAAAGNPNRCSACKATLSATIAGADASAVSKEIEAIADWTDRVPDWALERLSEILNDRARARGQGRAN